MYKLLLSWRYLLTRYLALASIISVMLGVATLIVVNSVMGGFATKLKDRMRGIQADILIESRNFDGFYDYQGKMQQVRELLGDKIEAMSPLIESVAFAQFRYKRYNDDGDVIREGELTTKMVGLYGVDPSSKSRVSAFGEYLVNPENRANPAQCFTLHGKALERYRRQQERRRAYDEEERRDALRSAPGLVLAAHADEPPPPEPAVPPPDTQRVFGVVLGYGIATFRDPDAAADDPNRDQLLLRPGDEITLITMSRTELEGHDGTRGIPRPAVATFVITDLIKSDMAEYDARMTYVDLRDLQQLRTMYHRATCIQIKLKDYDRDAKQAVDVLSQHFHPAYYLVQTWEHKQGPLLAAISIERSILNVLLFLIIAVAGFGILAIFYMIVVEKTRDIGILKALGASNTGVMGIFLGYGLTLGLVGAGLGTALGIAITVHINEIEKFIARVTGADVFPRDVYYFDKIPTDMQPASILMVVAGAVFIAVAASVFPALRAAWLHPVRALRYE